MNSEEELGEKRERESKRVIQLIIFVLFFVYFISMRICVTFCLLIIINNINICILYFVPFLSSIFVLYKYIILLPSFIL